MGCPACTPSPSRRRRLQMLLAHRDGSAPSLLELLRAGLPYGTYRSTPDGSVRGLF